MIKTENLVIFTGTNSELARPFVNYFSQQTKTKIIATFNNRPIQATKNIIPIQVNLENKQETSEKIKNILEKQDISYLKKLYLMHMIGMFKYEGEKQIPEIDRDGDEIDDEVYNSNITVFDNVYDILQEYINFQNNSSIQTYLFNIGSKRDYNPSRVPRRSYAIVKNILREKFKTLSHSYKNIHSLFINASTIDILKERQLRPLGEYKYWLSVDKIYQQSIQELQCLKGNKEVEIFKYHPLYETAFQYETLEQTHNRWMREMGKKR